MSVGPQAADYLGASKRAISEHYDLPSEFFALWLDPTLTYTCALWEPGDTLESAQVRKLDHLVAGARAEGADRVLDIGCGWGSLLRRLTERHEVKHAVGLTLSESQAKWATTQGLPAGAEVLVENWADHRPGEPYDAIISIGAFEHFARYGLSRDERVASYRRFFTSCREWLGPGARLALQTNVKGGNKRLDKQAVRDMLFIIETIFQESELPILSEITDASAGLFEVVSVRNDPDHYAQTLTAWHSELVERHDEAVAVVGDSHVRDYERYLGATVDHFTKRHLGLLRIIFEAL